MSYQLYRSSTIGQALQDTIDECVTNSFISPEIGVKTMMSFDRAINQALASRIKNKIQFKGHLNTYRYCDNVWTLNLSEVEFHDSAGGTATATGGGIDQLHLHRLKVVACEWQRSRQAAGKSAAGSGGAHSGGSGGGGSHSRSSRAAQRNARAEEPDDSSELVDVEEPDIASLDEHRT